MSQRSSVRARLNPMSSSPASGSFPGDTFSGTGSMSSQSFDRRVGPMTPPQRPVFSVPPLWQLIVALLDEHQFDFKPEHLAPHLGIKIGAVHYYCRELWPEWQGQYNLDFDQAAVLIYRICRDGRKLPNAEELYKKLLVGEAIRPDFPRGYDNIERAAEAIKRDRERRAKK